MSKSFLGESTRRDWLRTFVGGAMLIAGGRWGKAAPNAGHVALSPELTEGPYYINLERIRRDITEGKRGLPLRMRLKVIDGASGAPIPGAAIDVWHAMPREFIRAITRRRPTVAVVQGIHSS